MLLKLGRGLEHQLPMDHSQPVAPVEVAALDVVVAFSVVDELVLDGFTELMEENDEVAEALRDVEEEAAGVVATGDAVLNEDETVAVWLELVLDDEELP
jgi:hypothetical protein